MKFFATLTLAQALLILGMSTLILGGLLGTCIWLVATDRAPPSLLIAPIASILTGVAAGVTAWAKGYAKGLLEMPPGVELVEPAKAARTLPPSALPIDVVEDVTLPSEEARRGR